MKTDLTLHRVITDRKTPLWVRPADWLPLPVLAEGQQRVVGLFAIYDTDDNWCSMLFTGAYTVDWGDGVIEDFASGATALHKYVYSSISSTTFCSRGYRQVIISVTPQQGEVLIIAGLVKSISTTYSNKRISPFLDISMVGSSITTITTSSSNLTLRSLEQFTFVGENNITNFSYMFLYCCLLQSVSRLDTSKGLFFSYMFQYCYSLQAVPLLDTSKGENFSYMFQNCNSLQVVPLLDTSKGENFSNMFNGCNSLQVVPLLDTSKGENFSYMFQGCYSLQVVPLLDTSQGSNFSYMFRYCYSLQAALLLDTSQGLNFSNMFNGCNSLQVVPLLDTGQGTGFSDMFSGCYSLARGALLLPAKTISFNNCSLSRDAIVEIFNNLASGVTGQTITITGNSGVATLTQNDRDIAINKGWTIVG